MHKVVLSTVAVFSLIHMCVCNILNRIIIQMQKCTVVYTSFQRQLYHHTGRHPELQEPSGALHQKEQDRQPR